MSLIWNIGSNQNSQSILWGHKKFECGMSYVELNIGSIRFEKSWSDSTDEGTPIWVWQVQLPCTSASPDGLFWLVVLPSTRASSTAILDSYEEGRNKDGVLLPGWSKLDVGHYFTNA